MNKIHWTINYGYMDLIDDLQEQADREVDYLRELNPMITTTRLNAYREGFMQGGLAAVRILLYGPEQDETNTQDIS